MKVLRKMHEGASDPVEISTGGGSSCDDYDVCPGDKHFFPQSVVLADEALDAMPHHGVPDFL